ncbi:unnamed protein product [Linum trigynum]|uniref:CCHC-type domain-containing protein n=1 Tax=Linum trigynum TaxID=586398 RepID=A0AAV2F780_9ROSI
MAAAGEPVAPLAPPQEEARPPDPSVGLRRPPEVSSSPDGKKDREVQQLKKRVRPLDLQDGSNRQEEVIVEDITEEELQKEAREDSRRNTTGLQSNVVQPPQPPMAWGVGRKKLFSEAVREETWYVEDSDTEEEVVEMREDTQRDQTTVEEDPRCPTIYFSPEEWHNYRREWRSALMVKVLGRSYPYPIMAKRLNMLWARNRTIQITNRPNGFFFVRFTSKLDYELALTGGPWLIGDNYITIQKWKKGFDPRTCQIQSTSVWIRLPDLPIELYHPEAVLRIAKRAGTPIRVDRATELGARGVFARACIEVDLTKPLLSKYKVEGVEYEIKYEGLENICFECGTYGHSKTSCPKLHGSDQPIKDPVDPVQTQGRKHEEPYGEWMIAKRRDRRPKRGMEQVKTGAAGQPNGVGNLARSGSRFDVLQEEETTASSHQRVNLDRGSVDTRQEKTTQERPSTSNTTPKVHQVWVEKSTAPSISSREATGHKSGVSPSNTAPVKEPPSLTNPTCTDPKTVEHAAAETKEKGLMKEPSARSTPEKLAGKDMEQHTQAMGTPPAMQAMHTASLHEELSPMNVDSGEQAMGGKREYTPTGVPQPSL